MCAVAHEIPKSNDFWRLFFEIVLTQYIASLLFNKMQKKEVFCFISCIYLFIFACKFLVCVYLERCLTGIGDPKCKRIAQFINRSMCLR